MKSAIFLDNNVFDPMMKHIKFQKKWDAIANKYKVLRTTGVSVAVSPFVFLEYIGIRAPNLERANIPPNWIQNKDTVAIAEWIADWARKKFANHPDVSIENILRRIDVQSKYVSPECKKLWKITIEDRVSKLRFEEQIYAELAVDYAYKFQYTKTIRRQMHCAFWINGCKAIARGEEPNLFRVVKSTWDALDKKGKDKLRAEQGDQRFYRLVKSMGVKPKKDFLDSELIFQSVVGRVVDGVRLPVNVFTKDSEVEIRDRISVFKGMLDDLYPRINKIGKGFDSRAFQSGFPLAPGTVFIMNKNGDLMGEPIEVGTIPPL